MVGLDPERDKANQDDFAADACFMGDPKLGVFAVCDGHGPNGRRVSTLLAGQLCSTLESEWDPELAVERVIKRAFLKLNVQLLRSQVDCAISGSTLVALVLSGTRVYAANVGDSRCVAGLRLDDGSYDAQEWTHDQKPDVPEEEQRLLAMGARLAPLGEGHDGHMVNRIWLADKDTPGIAMSRSFGDVIATTVGVISEPVISEHALSAAVRFVILATDGIWEFIGSQEAVELVGKSLDAGASTDTTVCKLVLEASRRWISHEHLADDITAILLVISPDGIASSASASAGAAQTV